MAEEESQDDKGTEQKPQGKPERKVASGKPEPQMPGPRTFLEKVFVKGYNYADAPSRIEGIEHELPKEFGSLGLMDSNGYKIRLVTLPWAKWKDVAEWVNKTAPK